MSSSLGGGSGLNQREQEQVLKNMILSFRVSELQMLLGFAGRNKNGKKQELQERAVQLVKIRSPPMQAKIRELYKSSQAAAAAASCEEALRMMGQGAPPGAAGQPLYNLGYGNMSAAAAMMGLTGAYPSPQQLTLQGRNPYTNPSTGYPQTHGAGASSSAASLYNYQVAAAASHHSAAAQRAAAAAAAAAASIPVQPDVKLVKLPFYDVHAELLRPSSLIAQGNNRFQEAQFQFFLSPAQATEIASHRDIRMGSKLDYLYQIQLRFCPLSLDTTKEMSDEFPPGILLQVNGKGVTLPNPIPTNRPGVEPKRPSKPVNITSYCKLSPILHNSVYVKWAAEYGKGWAVGIWLVMKCTSDDLLDRLKKRGTRNPEFTRKTIIAKMTDDDDVATECLRVSVACPLGKMRMSLPCRPTTCNHLQCFDGNLFLKMNERKPTWNCPVCDSKALFDDLMIDGYFTDVINSSELPKDENDIILNPDGSWKPVPKEEDNGKTKESNQKKSSSSTTSASQSTSNGSSTANSGGGKKDDGDIDCIDLSDDDDDIPAAKAPPLPPPQTSNYPAGAPPPLPTSDPAPPPPPPPEIECIDLE